MALEKKNTKEYLRIDKEYFIDFLKNIHYKMYKNSELRNNPDLWTKIQVDSLHCDKLEEKLNATADSTKSIADNLLTAMYEAMKEENVISINYSNLL